MIALSLVLLAQAVPVSEPAKIDVAAQTIFVESAVKAGRYTQARDMIVRLREAPSSAEIQAKLALLAGQVELAEQQNAAATAEFAAALDVFPDNCIAIEGSGIAAARSGKIALAQTLLRKATALCADRWQSWNALGVVADELSDWDVATQAYQAADALSPGNAVILNNYGFSLYSQGHADEAERMLRVAAGLAPDNQRVANNLDIVAAANGQDFFKKAAGDTPDRWAQRLNNAGYAAFKAGDLPRARALLSEALQTHGSFYAKAAANLELAGK